MKRIGIIGLDSSHAVELARYFNAGPGARVGRVAAAWPGGSPDAPLSIDRVAGFTQQVRDEFGVEIVATPEDVAARSDALLLLTMDGRCHAGLFARVASAGCPMFINKPLTASVSDAEAIAAMAARNRVGWFSASALRWAWPPGRVARSVSVSCPLWFEPANVGWFWYGVHGVELMQTAMGPGIAAVRVDVQPDRETLHARWHDGREAQVIGVLKKDAPFAMGEDGGALQPIAVSMEPLSAAIAEFFTGAAAPIGLAAMLEAIQVLAAANLSRTQGGAEIVLPAATAA